MNLVLIAALFFIGLFIKWYYKYFTVSRYLFKYKGPSVLPIIGNIHHMPSTQDRFELFLKFTKEYGKVFSFWVGFRPRLIISDPDMVKFILSSTTMLEKSAEYKYLHSWLGTGLLTCSGSTWSKQRKLITPAFHFQILEQFVGIFNSQSNILRKKLLVEVNGEPFDIFPYMNLCALDIICEAAMGTQVNAQEDRHSKYVRCVSEMCASIVHRTFSPLKSYETFYKLTKDYQNEKEVLSVLHGYTDSVIQTRRNEILMQSEENNIFEKKRLALLDLLLQSRMDGEALSDQAIRQEVDTFMFEGHDTTASGISFALYSLSKHPDVQEKVVQELRDIFGKDTTRAATYNELQEMKYLEMVLKESLRLYPSVPICGRLVEKNYEYNDVVLPKGLTLTLFVLGLHMQEDHFPNPTKFDPERFSVENSQDRSPFSYVPFSAGPRNCIGQRFAMLEMKSTISTILRHYELLPVVDHNPKLVMEVVLKSSTGLLVKLKHRKF